MANSPIEDLREAILAAAAQGPVELNTAFIKAANAALNPPEDFDAQLTAAWRLGDAKALALVINPNNVSVVRDGAFRVVAAQLEQGFLNAAANQTDATLYFAQPADALSVQIECHLLNWDFPDFFNYWNGWLFAQFVTQQPTFISSTENQLSFTWSGNDISLSAGQNFAAALAVPQSLQPYFNLLQGLASVPSDATVYGPISVDLVDNDNVLYPTMDMKAVVSDASVQFFFLNLNDPYVGFLINTAVSDEAGELDRLLLAHEQFDQPLDNLNVEQSTTISVGTRLTIQDENNDDIDLTLSMSAEPSGKNFGLILATDENSAARLTPAAIISLMNGNSYLQLVPTQLQQFLTNVSLNGINLTGTTSPATLSSLSIDVGSVPGTELVLFGDPTNGQSFVIKEFSMVWTINSPLDPTLISNQVVFTTSFTIFEDIFRKPNGDPGGEFAVTINQDFDIDARFDGVVSMDDLLRGITAGNIDMPNGISVEFSDVRLSISPSNKAYSFGFVANVEVDFITFDGQPLIRFQDVAFDLSANTPTASSDKTPATVYRGAITGQVSIADVLAVNASVEYDGTASPPEWNLNTSLAAPLELSQLLSQFFRSFQLPDFLPGNLTVETFAVTATIPVSAPSGQAQNQSSYTINGSIRWVAEVPGLPIDILAEIGLAYDGNKPKGQNFSGSVIGTLNLSSINLEVQVGYRFSTAQQDAIDRAISSGQLRLMSPTMLPSADQDSTALWLEWQGFRAEYNITQQKVSFSLRGWTVGRLLEELVRTIGDPYFTLDSPWDLLNQISLEGLQISYNLKPGVQYPIEASYSLPSPINLGFVTIKGLAFKRVDGQITIAIDGTTTIPGLQDQPLFNPNGNGQNVQDMPEVPGQGSKLFELQLLALGQRVAIRDAVEFDSVPAIIKALQGIPPTSGNKNPVNPTNPEAGQPYYHQPSNWLAATHFGILKVGNEYTFDMQVVFNDPDVYGLRLAFAGEKAKVLAGLVLEIFYKRISDDVGLYQLDFSFPAVLRKLQFGAYTITLPEIRIQIYTNGDFLFDFGFPRNLDFSRSFTLEAIIFVGPVPVPILGSAGFYFGKLSSASNKNLPQTTKGTFNPAIVFGVGLQFGFGKSIEAGILRAGFSITVFGIIEGTIAAWHPYQEQLPPPGGSDLQGDYYFKMMGTVGLIGKLYGTIDFAIIKADVNVLVQVYLQITYESFRAIPITVAAHVSVKVSVKINLGLFSIKISFSFSATVKASATLGQDSEAPWDDTQLLARRFARLGRHYERQQWMRSLALPQFNFKPLLRSAEDKLSISLVTAPQYTVLTPDQSKTQLSDQQGAFILLLAMDAPTEDGGNQSGSSFQNLCQELLPWIIDAVQPDLAEYADLQAAQNQSVNAEELQRILDALSNNQNPPITLTSILTFLQSAFSISVQAATDADDEAMGSVQDGATLFPPFNGFTLTVPDPVDATKTVKVTLGEYVQINEVYRDTIAQLFDQLAAQLKDDDDNNPQALALDDTLEPLMSFVFVDYFLLLAKQLVQLAADALSDYDYPLNDGDSIESIINWADQRGNVLDVEDITEPNLATPLSADIVLAVDLDYIVQPDDSVSNIAQRYSDTAEAPRWQTSPAELIRINATRNNLIRSGIEITLGETAYRTQPGDDFNAIAAGLGLTLDQLASNAEFQNLPDVLAPSISLTIPRIGYHTAKDGSDTLAAVIGLFNTSLAALFSVASNLQVVNLFDRQQRSHIPIANLQQLTVNDLWNAILARERLASVAGMAARYQMHGMRLPNVDGLSLPEGYLYPTSGQSDYGLYQLTGQQVPTPIYSAADGYIMSVSKDAQLDWIQFIGAKPDGSLAIDLASQFFELDTILEWARTVGYRPSTDLSIEPLINLMPAQVAARSITPWTGSNLATLTAITQPQGAVTESSGTQVQPLIWQLPDNLLAQAEAQQSRLQRIFGTSLSEPYLSVWQPNVGVTDPATQRTSFTAVEQYVMATVIQFQVKQLAQDADQTPPNPHANDTVPPGAGNAGSQARPLAPYSYELIGPSPTDAVLLERLLTAMDQQGDGLVAGIFLAYANNASAPTALISRDASEFLAFITQTNLSTETNPASLTQLLALAKEGGSPRGIANTPAEFIRLMWELSTVNSGGYYLYYQVPDEEAGLPDVLFDDSGSASLSLVIAYDRKREPANGGRLSNYANALISTDNIDPTNAVLSFLSQNHTVDSQPLQGQETLNDIAQLYGSELLNLILENPELTFNQGVVIPIAGVIHQVTQADVASGNVYATLANYYSAGSEQPLTAEQIADFNPGLNPELESAVRIPDLNYVVGDHAPGQNAQQLQAYYGYSAAALAYQAAEVALFPAGAKLKVNSVQLAPHENLGLGNTGVALSRENLGDPPDLPPDPTPEQKAEFAKASMYSLYQLLSSGFADNPFFKGSQQGLSFGPRKSLTPDEAEALRRPQTRRELFAVQEEEPFEYGNALGFFDFTTVNAGPAGGGDLPPQNENPYRGVGGLAQTKLRWLDWFGNITATPFSNPQDNILGPLNQPPGFIAYADRPIGLSQWPNVRSTYSYGGEPGAPVLQLQLRLNTQSYLNINKVTGQTETLNALGNTNDQQQLESDRQSFANIYWQLEQNYDEVGIPGFNGYAIEFQLINSLLQQPEQALDQTQSQALRDFVKACLIYLTRLIKGQNPGADPVLTLSIPVALDSVALDNIVELQLALVLQRQAALCAPELRAIEGGLRDETQIQPQSDAPQSDGNGDGMPQQTLKVFASEFERVFVKSGSYQLRVGTSAADPSQPTQRDVATVWAVRLGQQTDQGLHFKVEPGASFYAPEPISRELISKTIQLNGYTSGQPYPDGEEVTVRFTGADPNVMAGTAFTAIDTFLTPTFSSPAFILDQLLFDDPENEGFLSAMLQSKKDLAAAVAKTIKPILSDSADDEASLVAAGEKLEQSLLRQLSNANTLTAVVLFQVTQATTNEPIKLGTDVPPRFFGQPVGELVDMKAAEELNGSGGAGENYSLSSAKIPLNSAGGATQSTMAFLFSSKNIQFTQENAYVPLNMSYQLTQLEHQISAVPGIEGYQQSAWINFITGPFGVPLLNAQSKAQVDIPIVLRALPQPPDLGEQGFATVSNVSTERMLVGQNGDPAELSQWTFAYSYSFSATIQDSFSSTVELNRGLNNVLLKTEAETLFDSLAQFVTIYPAIASDLKEYLVKINGQTPADSENVVNAQYAVAALVTITQQLTQAYRAFAQRDASLLRAQALNSIIYPFDVVLENINSRAQVNIYGSKPVANLPAPVMLIEPDQWIKQDVSPPAGALAAYQYHNEEGQYLTVTEALAQSQREIQLPGLNIFAYQNALASIQVVRNRFLVPNVATRETFQFRTPVISFPDPLVPLLSYETFDLGSLLTGEHSLQDFLAAFFDSLFSQAVNQAILVKMTNGYSYRIIPQMEHLVRTQLPISLLAPVPVTPTAGITPGFVQSVANNVDQWLSNNVPVSNSSAQLNFSLEIFAGEGINPNQQMPLLRVRNLYLAAERLKLASSD